MLGMLEEVTEEDLVEVLIVDQLTVLMDILL
jgi:hypothetical protein